MKEYSTPFMMYLDRLTILQRIHMHQKRGGIHFRQMPILIYIEHTPGCTQQEIAKAIGLTASSIALSTKRLEKAGFLIKEQDKENLRCNRLTVSEKGHVALDEAKQQAQRFEQELLQGISREELQQVENVLQKMIFNLTGETTFDPLDNFKLIYTSHKKEEDVF